jgi:hypothetical protein
MRFGAARTDNHVVSLVKLLQELSILGGIVLSVPIHERDDIAACCARTRFDGGTIAQALRVLHDPGSCFLGHFCRIVAGAIVNDDDFRFRILFLRPGDGCADGAGFI